MSRDRLRIGDSVYRINNQTLKDACKEGRKRYEANKDFRPKYRNADPQALENQHIRGYLGELTTANMLSLFSQDVQRHFADPKKDKTHADIQVEEKLNLEIKTQREENWDYFGRTVPVSQLKEQPKWNYIIFVTLLGDNEQVCFKGYATVEQLKKAPVVNLGSGDNYQLPADQIKPIDELLDMLESNKQCAVSVK